MSIFANRVYTVCKGQTDLQTKDYNIFCKLQPDTRRNVQWIIPSLLYQTRRKNALVYKGLMLECIIFQAC